MKKVKQILVTTFLLTGFIFVGSISNTQMIYAAECGGVQTSIINCDQEGDSERIEDSGLWYILALVINIMTAGVGLLAVAGIVYGAVLYTSAGGSQEQVKKAIEIIRNVVIGVIAFALMWAILNFIIPGGLVVPV